MALRAHRALQAPQIRILRILITGRQTVIPHRVILPVLPPRQAIRRHELLRRPRQAIRHHELRPRQAQQRLRVVAVQAAAVLMRLRRLPAVQAAVVQVVVIVRLHRHRAVPAVVQAAAVAVAAPDDE